MDLARTYENKRNPNTYSQEFNETRRTILEKMEAKRQQNQQNRNYLYDTEPPQNGIEQRRGPTAPIMPQSAKNESRLNSANQNYFKKDRIEGGKATKGSTSSDNKARSTSRNNPYNQDQSEAGLNKASSEYLKLHDKLNFLEHKISEMKKNIQKKKEEKIKKKQDQEEKKILSEEQKKSNGKKSTIALNDLVTKIPERKELHSFSNNPYSPRHNIYYVSEIVRAYQDFKSIAREHLQTSLQIMAYFSRFNKPSEEEIAHKKVKLPRRKGYENKKTVVFDLDETLIHCNETLDVAYDVKLPITFPNGEVIEAGINIRPHAKEILMNLSKNFEVIVFTASHSCYANVVLDHLDPDNKYVHHRLYREHCYATPEGMHVKDLRIIDRDLENMVLVDNAAYSYAYQIDNGIPILPYYHGRNDFELKALQSYIESMLLNDMRKVNKKTFKLHLYEEYFSDLEKLVEDLYLVEHNH